MNTTPLYLRQDIQLEPLVDQWYAWPHLIPPATLARNLTDRHFRIMDSYVAAPETHAKAVANPKMRGGPFIDYGGQRLDEIRALRDLTKRRRAALIELSAAISELDNLLRTQAFGHSLESLYQRTPESLRGYVELVYDLNNHPSFLLLEPLLYRSRYHETAAQSIMLSISTGDDRPFVLSTPRLEGPGLVHIQTPFHSPGLDALFRAKTRPTPFSNIRNLLNIKPESEELFRSFFTEAAPRPYLPYTGPGARWRYFGHACILLECNGVSVLCDPVLSYTYDSQISRYTYLDLPDHIDFVLITHNHQDHVLFETLLQIRHKVGAIVIPRGGNGMLQDPSLRLLLEACGFTNVVEIGAFESVSEGDVSVIALPFLGEHGDLNIPTKAAYLVRLGDHKILFAADSCNIEPALYRHVHREVGDIDALFLGMECDGAPLSWLYGPLLTQRIERNMDGSRRLAGSNFAQAQQIVDEFCCKEVYVYAMGQEPWLNHVMSLKYSEASRPITESNRLLADCRRRGITAERLFGEKEILIQPVSSRAAGSAVSEHTSGGMVNSGLDV